MERKSNKLFKYIWNFIKTITTFIIILIVLTIFLQRMSNNRLTLGGYGIYTVVTKSMVPKYQVGDMLLSKNVNPDTLVIGDDIVYQGKEGTFEGKIITHKLIAIDEENGNKIFHTKGIANTIEDPTITREQIYGKIITKLTILSVLTKIIRNQYGFFFIVLVPIVILVFGVILDVVNDKKKS